MPTEGTRIAFDDIPRFGHAAVLGEWMGVAFQLYFFDPFSP